MDPPPGCPALIGHAPPLAHQQSATNGLARSTHPVTLQSSRASIPCRCTCRRPCIPRVPIHEHGDRADTSGARMKAEAAAVLDPLWQGVLAPERLAAGHGATCELPAALESVREARHFTRTTLQRWDLAALRDCHGARRLRTGDQRAAVRGARWAPPGAPVRLSLVRWTRRVVCAVRDPSGVAPIAEGPGLRGRDRPRAAPGRLVQRELGLAPAERCGEGGLGAVPAPAARPVHDRRRPPDGRRASRRHRGIRWSNSPAFTPMIIDSISALV